jgi:hypothetical protein
LTEPPFAEWSREGLRTSPSEIFLDEALESAMSGAVVSSPIGRPLKGVMREGRLGARLDPHRSGNHLGGHSGGRSGSRLGGRFEARFALDRSFNRPLLSFFTKRKEVGIVEKTTPASRPLASQTPSTPLTSSAPSSPQSAGPRSSPEPSGDDHNCFSIEEGLCLRPTPEASEMTVKEMIEKTSFLNH